MKSFTSMLRLGVLLGAFSVALPVAALGVHASPGNAAGGSFMSPGVAIGPEAQLANAASTNYGLYTCQLGLSAATCYDPYQMRTAYHLNSLISAGYTGVGKTIVIVDAYGSPYLSSDLASFDGFYSLPGGSSNSFLTQVAPDGVPVFDPHNGTEVGWSQETTLDVEWAHAIAPGAKIVLDIAKSSNDSDILSATKYAVDNHLGDVISQSFGENESCVDPSTLAAEHQVFAQATRENITLLASSGDQGASQQTCDGNSWTQAASSPASDPLVTAVGGTELHAAGYCLASLGCNPATASSPGTYQGEIAWNEFNSESTGGGFSTLYNEPSYQKGIIHGGKQRAVPDVAYNAAIYHGVLVKYAGHTYLFGGTSCGSPQWAGIVAIADQLAGHALGFVNTALYHLAHSPKTYGAEFNDVTSGSNSVVETDANHNPVAVQGFSAGDGWDPTTGLGSPISDQLIPSLIQHVSAGDGNAAIAESNPHGNSHQPSKPGHVHPH